MKNMMTLIFTLLIAQSAFALCGNDKIVIQAVVTSETSDLAYGDEISSFRSGDVISVYEIETGKSIYLTTGTFEDDGAGNYTISASNNKGQSIDFTHDHETWHTDGLYGSYRSTTGEKVDLYDMICDYDDLFLFL